MRFILYGVLISFFAASSDANEATPAFEVVSIKPSAGPARARVDRAFLNYPFASLKFLIMRAYEVRSDQIDGPSWLGGPPEYDFTAKLPQDAMKAQIPALLQATLAERFKLKVHWEPRMDPVYVLVTETSGVKLKKADPATPPGRIDFSSSGHYSLRGATMELFARILSSVAGRRVFDKTGVSETFDIDFDAEPPASLRQPPEAGGPATSNELPSIFSVVHSFGLKLQPQKAEVNHLVSTVR
jgi:uncharacterized protein (TIGR03435 family)